MSQIVLAVFRHADERYLWDVARVRFRSRLGAVVMSVMITVIISPDGRITFTTDNPDDFERAREHIMSMMAALAGDNPIGYSDCLDPEDVDAIARRLAKRIMREEAA